MLELNEIYEKEKLQYYQILPQTVKIDKDAYLADMRMMERKGLRPVCLVSAEFIPGTKTRHVLFDMTHKEERMKLEGYSEVPHPEYLQGQIVIPPYRVSLWEQRIPLEWI